MSERPEQDAVPEPRVSVPVPKVSALRRAAGEPRDAVPDAPVDTYVPPRSGPDRFARASILSGLAAFVSLIPLPQNGMIWLSPLAAGAAIVFGAASRKRSRRLWGHGSDAGAIGIVLGSIALIAFSALFVVALMEWGTALEQQGVTRLVAARA
jgi:hypothetical protein